MEYETEIIACVQGLGGLRETEDGVEVYVKGEDCIECIRDLMRYVRRDDPETLEVHKQLGGFCTLQDDLIPLILAYREESELVFAVTKMLALLTMAPNKKVSELPKLIHYQQTYKEAFLRQDVLAILMSWMAESLAREGPQRTEEDRQRIELLLSLFRNLLQIPDPLPSANSSRDDHKSNLQQQLLAQFQRENVFEALLLICQSIKEPVWQSNKFVFMEIFYHIFSKTSPTDLFSVEKEKAPQSAEISQPGATTLAAMLLKDQKHKAERASMLPSRHSRFGTNLLVNRGDGTGTHIVSNIFAPAEPDTVKKSRRRVITKKIGASWAPRPILDLSLKEALKDLAEQFIELCFTPLIELLRKDLEEVHTTTLEENDKVHYWSLIAFVLEFHRIREKKRYQEIKKREAKEAQQQKKEKEQKEKERQILAEIANSVAQETGETGEAVTQPEEPLEVKKTEYDFDRVPIVQAMNLNAFKYMHRILDTVCDTKIKEQNPREVRASVHLFKEMALTLQEMALSHGEATMRNAEYLQSNIFYEEGGPLFTCRKLLRFYVPKRHDEILLVEIVEATHVFLKLLECYSKGRKLFVQVKRRVYKKKNQDGTVTIADSENQGENPNPNLNPNSDQNPNPDESPLSELNKAQEKIAETILTERQFDWEKELDSFAEYKIVYNYIALLGNYKKNSQVTNHYVVKYIHRMIKEIKEADGAIQFYHANIMNVVNKILNDKSIKGVKEYAEVWETARYLSSKFLQTAQMNSLLFVEALFKHRTKAEREMILHNYDIPEKKKRNKNKDGAENGEMFLAHGKQAREWTSEEDDILRNNFQTYSQLESCNDVLSGLLTDRSARQVALRLVDLGLKEAALQVLPKTDPIQDLNRAVKRLVQMRSKLPFEYKFALNFIEKQIDECRTLRDSFSEEERAARSKIDYAIVPLAADDFMFTEHKAVHAILTALDFREPLNGEWCWRIPGSISSIDLAVMSQNIINAERLAVNPPPLYPTAVNGSMPAGVTSHSYMASLLSSSSSASSSALSMAYNGGNVQPDVVYVPRHTPVMPPPSYFAQRFASTANISPLMSLAALPSSSYSSMSQSVTAVGSMHSTPNPADQLLTPSSLNISSPVSSMPTAAGPSQTETDPVTVSATVVTDTTASPLEETVSGGQVMHQLSPTQVMTPVEPTSSLTPTQEFILPVAGAGVIVDGSPFELQQQTQTQTQSPDKKRKERDTTSPPGSVSPVDLYYNEDVELASPARKQRLMQEADEQSVPDSTQNQPTDSPDLCPSMTQSDILSLDFPLAQRTPLHPKRPAHALSFDTPAGIAEAQSTPFPSSNTPTDLSLGIDNDMPSDSLTAASSLQENDSNEASLAASVDLAPSLDQ
eukprot:GILK01008568.1.p1 GENE.GILK01008568.1~~GILK01008568.1.p1  ORF type:complete len:1379 (-),score=332.12 GILK01008568.1:34-4131(-)